MDKILKNIDFANSQQKAEASKQENIVSDKKLFYQEVSYQQEGENFIILLDDRPVKTPYKKILALPKEALAQCIVEEFLAQRSKIDPQKMPFLRISNTVLDGIDENIQILIEDVLRYMSSDMLFYRAYSPEALVLREKKLWDPVIDSMEEMFGVKFHIQSGILPHKQDPMVINVISQYLRYKLQNFEPKQGAFVVAAFHMITTLSHSILLAISAFEQKISFDALINCAFLEEDWTAEQWGKDPEAEQKKAARIEDLKAAFHLLNIMQMSESKL